MGYRRGLTPPKYPEPTVKPENRVTLLEAIGDLITDTDKKIELILFFLNINVIVSTDVLLVLMENRLLLS